MKEERWLKTLPHLCNITVKTVRKNVIKFLCASLLLFSELWGGNGSLCGKLYSERHLTPPRREQRAVILLPPCWLPDIFVRCRADLRNQSFPGAAHSAAFCFMLHRLLPPPQRHYAANTSNYTEPCGTCGSEQTKKTLTGMRACALAKAMSLSWQSHMLHRQMKGFRGQEVHVRCTQTN